MSNEVQRIQLVIEVTVPKDRTPRDVKEWFLKHLDYFHPALKPSYVVSATALDPEKETPEDLL